MEKKAAIQMSTTTIIVIVLSVALLIFGMIFVKNIMCSGIVLTDKITSGVENEIKNLFSVNDYGIKCLGEGGQDVRLGDGGKRQIYCVVNPGEQTEYSLEVTSTESLDGASDDEVQTWLLDSGWQGTIPSGGKTVTVALLDIPKNLAKDTALKITIEETNLGTSATETHISYVDVTHVSGLTSAIC